MSVAYDWNSQDFNEEITTHDPEKSYYDSQVFEKEIIWKTYDPFRDDFITINTVAYDINNKGLTFITKQPLEVGDPIFIRAKNLMSERRDNELDEGLHGQVIWCNRTFSQEHNLCYEVGVEYFN